MTPDRLHLYAMLLLTFYALLILFAAGCIECEANDRYFAILDR